MFSKMTSQNTSIYTPFADGRTVRDIVEHSPALVNETWCRDLLRHTLDSLERQYATGAPHRPISPDTVVMLDNNEALLLPAAEQVGAAGGPTLAADLHALALVVHYAITAELPPDGPLGPRLYDNYSTALTNGIDRCLGPNQRLRPKTIADMRAMLGIEATPADAPVHPSTAASDAAPAQEAVAPVTAMPVSAPAAPEPMQSAAPAIDHPAAPAQLAPTPDYGHPIPAPVTQEVRPVTVAATTRDEPGASAAPFLRTQSAAAAPDAPATHAAALDKRADLPPPAADAPLLRTPAAATAGVPPTPPIAATTKTHGDAARDPSPFTPPRTSHVQRWGWIAGALVVLLAAGGALVSYLQQDDARDMVAVSLPPAERAANGLDTGETVVAPRAEVDTPGAPGELVMDEDTPADSDLPAQADDGALPAAGAAATAAGAAPVSGKAGSSVSNGTTYKLLIKPWGTIYVDGVDRGVSPPVKRLTLSRGTHTIRIVNPSFPERIFTLDAGVPGLTAIEHDFTAKAE
jgi:hypothetical protein